MKIITKCVIDIVSGRVLREESYQYDGPLALCFGGKSDAQKEADRLAVEQQRQALAQSERLFQVFEEFLGITKEQFALIQPLAEQLINFGLDPVSFLSSPQGQALLAPLQQNTAANFEQARVNLIDSLAGQGLSPGSGVAIGPQANLFSQEAQAQSNNLFNLLGQSLNLGIQGANIAQGQQGVFNPFQATNSASGLLGPASNIGAQSIGTLAPSPGEIIAGALGSTLSGIAQFSQGGQGGGGCWIAEAIYGPTDIRTHLARYWLNTVYAKGGVGSIVMAAYRRWGQRVAKVVGKSRLLQNTLKPLFDKAVANAIRDIPCNS